MKVLYLKCINFMSILKWFPLPNELTINISQLNQIVYLYISVDGALGGESLFLGFFKRTCFIFSQK